MLFLFVKENTETTFLDFLVSGSLARFELSGGQMSNVL